MPERCYRRLSHHIIITALPGTMYFATLLTLALSTIVADCQNLHGWRQSVFAIGAERTVDGNPETYWQGGVPTTIMLLLSRAENYKGFYIQSSWPYITDYVVEGYSSSQGVTIIGQVTAARSNFVSKDMDPSAINVLIQASDSRELLQLCRRT
jgi:hypothetical protein